MGEDDQFKSKGAAVYEECHKAVRPEGTVCSEAYWTIEWPVGRARRLALRRGRE